MLELAYAWRFLPREQALRRTDELVARARGAGIVDLDAGARYLAGLGSPHGELAFAERLAREPRFARSAGIARVLALVGLGRPDTAIVLARALDVKPFAAELAAATVLLDADSARFVIEWPPVRAVLARDTVDRRAGWMLKLVEAAHAADGDPPSPSVSPIGESRAVGQPASPVIGPGPTAPPGACARSNAAAAHDRVPHVGPGAGEPGGRQCSRRPAMAQEPRAARLPRALSPRDPDPRASDRVAVGRQAGVD